MSDFNKSEELKIHPYYTNFPGKCKRFHAKKYIINPFCILGNKSLHDKIIKINISFISLTRWRISRSVTVLSWDNYF